MKSSAIILAGRSGNGKTPGNDDKKELIKRTAAELQKVVDEIIIVHNNSFKYDIAGTIETPDVFQGAGPLGGIHAGLLAAKYPYAFVIAADMPFFTAELVTYLLSRIEGYDVIAPEIKGLLQPLCAVYSQQCLKPIEQYLVAEIRQIKQVYPYVRLLRISEEELDEFGNIEELFYNLNISK